MKKFILIFCLLMASRGTAQEVPADLQQRLQGKTKLDAIMNEVNKYYLDAGPENNNNGFESSPYLKWVRWEWYMRPRLDKNGDFFDYRKLKQEEFNKLQLSPNRTAVTGSPWAFAGPHAMTYSNGFYRGLGRVDCIAFHPTNASIIFVGTPGGGIWKTADGGNNWNNISFNLPNTAVSSIAVSPQNPDIIYIATGDFRPSGSFIGAYNRSSIGVYKTTDGGIHWNPTNDDSTVTGNAGKIIVHPTNSDIVLVATSSGFYRTSNGGNVWTAMATGNFQDLCFKPGNPAVVYVAGFFTQRIMYSTDGGFSFSPATFNIMPASNRIRLAVSPNDPTVVYALCGPFRQSGFPAMSNLYEGLYKSIDSGVNFTRVNNSPNILSSDINGNGAATEPDQSGYDLAMAIKPSDDSVIATGGKCVWVTLNGGGSFASATDFAEIGTQMFRYIHPDIQDLAYNPLNNYLYAATDGGVYFSGNDGASWTDISAGIHTTMFYKLAGNEQNANLFIGGTQDNGVKFRNSATPVFNHITGGDGFDAVTDPTNSSKTYVTTNGPTLTYFVNGANPLNITPPGAADGFSLLAHHPAQTDRLYAAFQNGVWRRDFLPFPTWVFTRTVTGPRALITCPSNVNRIFFADNNGIYRSDDQGSNWTANLATTAAGFAPTRVVTDLYSSPGNADVLFATNSNGVAGQKVYYSTNAGATWINISGTLPNVAINCVAVDNNNNAYVGTDLGIFYQSAAATEWTPYYNGLPKVIISDLVINNISSIITAATYGHGVWQNELFSTCSINFNVSGSYTGEWFYNVSNQLTSNAEVYGGAGTKMHFRAGNEVVLNPGFTVYETSNFDAILAACDSGPVPQRTSYIKTPPARGGQRNEHVIPVTDTMKVKIKNR